MEDAGYYVGIYSNIDFLHLFNGLTDRYDLWLAQWGVSKPNKSVNMWQYTDNGVIAGIEGKIDMNVSIDFPSIIKGKGLNNLKPDNWKCPNKCPHCPWCK